MAPPDTTASIDDSGTEACENVHTPPGSDDQEAQRVHHLAERLENIITSMDTFPTVKVARNISAHYALSLGRKIVDIQALFKDLINTNSAHRENRYLLVNILNNMYSCRRAVEAQSVVPHSFATQHGATDAPTGLPKVQLKSSIVNIIAAKPGGYHALKARSITSEVTTNNYSQAGLAGACSEETEQNSFKETATWCERCWNPSTMTNKDRVQLCDSCDSHSHGQHALNNRETASVDVDGVLVL